VLFCRRSALESVAADGEVFDESFFMYKEDVDLSLRLRRAGWRLMYSPQVTAGHVRGTSARLQSRVRRRAVRRRSVANEWRLLRKGNVPPRIAAPMFGYLLLKTTAVWVLGR
jgi:GT2 family glycosyltransferase